MTKEADSSTASIACRVTPSRRLVTTEPAYKALSLVLVMP